MTAHRYVIRRAGAWSIVLAFTRAHALRLWREGAECIRGADGRAERCGIVEEHGVARY